MFTVADLKKEIQDIPEDTPILFAGISKGVIFPVTGTTFLRLDDTAAKEFSTIVKDFGTISTGNQNNLFKTVLVIEEFKV